MNVNSEMTKGKQFKYFACDGGPHIVIPARVRSLWYGVGEDYDPADLSTDYARACEVEPPIGIIPVADAAALILAGSPPMTACSDVSRDGSVSLFIIEEWTSTDLDSLLNQALRDMSPEHLFDTGMRLPLDSDGLILMFAGDLPTYAAYGEVCIPLPFGQYRVLQHRYEGNEGKLWIVRLVR